ncbi:MAG TPA: lysophospholipid acyltransferase family protein [Dongiaceae bacterium]
MSLLRRLFMLLILRPLLLVAIGLNIRHRERLPRQGPAIVIANHNSHLDAFVLLSLFPAHLLDRVRPVAAADYFLRSRYLAWFTLNIVNMIPIERGGGRYRERGSQAGELDQDKGNPLQGCIDALRRGEILLIFPEGSRGVAEELTRFKGGVARLKEQLPDVPVIPVFMRGLGRILPKGEILLVPVVVDVVVGEVLPWTGQRASFTHEMEAAISALASSLAPPQPISG